MTLVIDTVLLTLKRDPVEKVFGVFRLQSETLAFKRLVYGAAGPFALLEGLVLPQEPPKVRLHVFRPVLARPGERGRLVRVLRPEKYPVQFVPVALKVVVS